MKFIRNALWMTTLLALQATAQPAQPTARPTQNVPPGLLTMPPKGPSTPPQMPDKDKMSYAIGMSVANSIKHQELTVDVDTIATAMKDVLSAKPTRLTTQEMGETLKQLNEALKAKAMAVREEQKLKMEKEAAENKIKGGEFLAGNAKLDGVKSLPNGLQYKVIKDGAGPMPKSDDTVTVSYKGKLIDGTQFDQNEHFTTPVTGRTIKGWLEILPMMKVGSKWEVFIPPDLGYGAQGAGQRIPPNSVLIFEMELLSVVQGAAKPPGLTAIPSTPPAAKPAPPVSSGTPVVSGQIIKVPSAEELKKGAKIEVITNVPPSQ